MTKKTVLAKNIKKLRLFKSLNQTEFAALFDLKRSSIGAYEEGRAEPKLEALIKISEHFKLSIDDIVKSELTVNKIAKFDFPDVNESDLDKISEQLEALSRRMDRMDRKIELIIHPKK